MRNEESNRVQSIVIGARSKGKIGRIRSEIKRIARRNNQGSSIDLLQEDDKGKMVIMPVAAEDEEILSHMRDDIVRMAIRQGVNSDHIVVNYVPIKEEQNNGYTTTIETLQRKAREQESVIEASGEHAEELVGQITDLEQRLREAENPGNRGDLFVSETIRLGRPEEFASISRAYEAALTETGLAGSEHLEDRIVELIHSSKLPFEKTDLYKSRKAELAQAQDAIKLAKKNKFIDTTLAEETIAEVESQKEKHEQKRELARPLRKALEGKSVKYLILSEQGDDSYKIKIVMPIKHRSESSDFSELEKDLIFHIHDQWNTVRSEIAGQFSRNENQGLVEYCYEFSDEKVDGKKMKKIEDKAINGIFDSQKQYSFGALGLRIDVERISNTDAYPVPTATLAVSQRSSSIEAPSEHTPTSTTEQIEPYTPRPYTEISASLSEDLAAQQEYKNLPDLDSLLESRSERKKIIQMAILQTLATADEPMKTGEINQCLRHAIPEVHKEVDFSVQHGWSVINTVMVDLRDNKRVIEKVGDGSQDPYRIKEEYK